MTFFFLLGLVLNDVLQLLVRIVFNLFQPSPRSDIAYRLDCAQLY